MFPLNNIESSVLFELYEAVRMSQKEKIRRLLRKRLCPNDQVVLQYAAVSQYDRSIFQIIKTDLSRRRIELLQLARGNLPTAQQAPYGINSETTIFASHAATVANRLHRGGSTDEDERDYYVPDYDGINCGMSVYSLVGCNQDVAQILYDPGFSNVDEPDAWNNSPLALIELPIVTEDHRPYRINSFIDGLDRYVSVYTWYKDKGALLDRPSGLERATPPHHIARRIGETFSSIPEVRDHALQSEEGNTTSHPDNWDLIRPILAESGFLSDKFRDAHNHDRFSCHCSVGCSLPLNVLLNTAFTTYIWFTRHRSITAFL
ncbi:uncharacterized protein BDV17DRAFT_100776 [Aspergillus undulatus]|uniref:uncharacterized protein n=1 Tax=Aspergillus undulatus TaxID=1810928 RepID=UPI003CCE0111